MLRALYAAQTVKDLGWILLAFAIFNTYMLLMATQVNAAIFGVFLTLEATEIVLFSGFFTGNADTIKAGGYLGVSPRSSPGTPRRPACPTGCRAGSACRSASPSSTDPFGLGQRPRRRRSPGPLACPGPARRVPSRPGTPRAPAVPIPRAPAVPIP